MAIDAIRGIFALLIVWHHLGPETSIPYHCDFGYSIVLFFFILSGFHMAIAWKERISVIPYRTFLLKRSAKMFPIQWLMVLLALVIGVEVAAWWTIPLQLTLTQSLVPLWESYFSLLVSSWFLSSLMFCYLFTYVLLRMALKYRNGFFCLLLCSIICFVMVLQFLPISIGRRWLVYINPFGRLIDYSLGICMAVYWMNAVKTKNINNILYISGYTLLELFFAVLMIGVLIDVPFSIGKFLDLRYPVVIGFIIVFSLARGYISKLLSNKYLVYLGSISLSIYMFHPIALHFFSEMVGVIPEWWAILLTYVVIIMSSHLLTHYYIPWGVKLFHTVTSKFKPSDSFK